MAPGRPSKYNTEFHPLLAEYMARAGMTDRQISEVLQIDEKTLNNWKHKHPDFFLSLKRGKEEPDDKVQAALLTKALGFERDDKYYPPDTTAQIFWLKNRRPKQWRDRREVHNTGEVTLADMLAGIDDEGAENA